MLQRIYVRSGPPRWQSLNLYHSHTLYQVAGLPPVTKEWFETRRAQLAGATVADTGRKLWIDPLTRKKFLRWVSTITFCLPAWCHSVTLLFLKCKYSENTYLAHIRSKKYQDLVKKSGVPVPTPIVITKAEDTLTPESGDWLSSYQLVFPHPLCRFYLCFLCW